MLFVAPGPTPARAATPATVSLDAEYVRIGATVAVTVSDAGASTAAVYTGETAGKTAYSLPVGSSGDTFLFQTLNPLLMDSDGDGLVSTSDLAISVTDAIPVSVVPDNGVFTLRLIRDVTAPISFAVTYAAERLDTLSVKVTSTSDATGFDLTIQETAPNSGVFSGTFETGAATIITNAANPAASARPDIKVVHGNVVSVTYTDTEPLSLVSDTLLVDGTAPTITLLTPAHNAFEQTFSSFFEARVTDADSGVNVSSIRFHYDNDGNNTFTEPGTILLPDPLMTTTEPTGVVVRVRVPTVAPDGLRTWYVTASDVAGVSGQSDAVAGTAGNQVHIFTSDQNPPRVVSAVAGEWYDTVSKTVKTGSRTSIRVSFSEKISVPSIIAGGFRLNGVPPISAQTYTALPNDVFLTVGSFPTEGPVILLIDSGSVTDLSGIKASLVPITITDKVSPVLTITFDRSATNSLVGIQVTSDEPLAAAPSITVNGLTRGAPNQIGDRQWELLFDVAALTGLDAGQGVKTVGATGFDSSNTLGTATPATFELDTTATGPALTPTGAVPISESFPDITASYAVEAGEYAGDTHPGVSLILATLDGEPVTPLMTTADAGVTWTLKGVDVRPDGFEKGIHVFGIAAVDVAGNTYELAQTVFEIDVDPPLPTPAVVEEDVDGDSAAPDEIAPVEETQPAEESSSVAEAGGSSDQTVEEASATTSGAPAEENLAAAVDDTPSEQVDTPQTDITEETAETAVVAGVSETAGDVAPAESDEPSGAVDPGPDPVTATEPSSDAEPVEPEDPAAQNVDPVFDREAEQAALDAEELEHASSTPEEGGGTIFGCNLPLGNSNVVGGEYALLGVGLLGLGLRRPAGALRNLLWPGPDASDPGRMDEAS